MSVTSRLVRYAPKVARFLVTSISDNLPHARRLVHAAPLSAIDGGDEGDYTVSVAGANSTTRGVIKLSSQLGGTADAPDVRGLRITGGDGEEGPQLLTIGDVKTGEALVRSGAALVSAPVLGRVGGTMTGNIAMGGHKVTGLAAGAGTDDAATYGQLTSMLNGLDWQASVLRADQNVVPTSPAPSAGDRFLVAAGASSGAWNGQSKKITVLNADTTWTFIAPTKGTTVHIETGAGAGTDVTYDGTNWVNIGASVDHNATLNRSADDAHSQYQLASAIDTANGYAGLTGGLVNKPVKAIRIVSDPGSPTPGEVWINGVDLKYRNNNGGGAQTEVVERVAMKDQNDGYAGLTGGLVNKPVKSIRTSSDPGSPSPGEVWVNGLDLRFRDNGGAPANRSVVTTGRQVTAGAGLVGGGDLSADRTLGIAAFSGVLSKELASAAYSFSANQILTHVVYDAGADGQILPTAVRLPARVDAALETRLLIVFDDNSTALVFNNTNSPMDTNFQGLANITAGDLTTGTANNGRSVRKLAFETRNTTGGSIGPTTIGPFRVRGIVFPRGGGSAL